MNCNVIICEEEGAISFKGISGDHTVSIDIFGRGVYFVEGSSGVEYCTVGNEQEDCNLIKNTGVESVKGMSMFDSP